MTACNSISFYYVRTVLQVTNAACPDGEKYTGTRTYENVLIQVVIGDVPPRHDKVRRGKDTVRSCTLARTSSPARATVVSCPPTLQSNHRDKQTWERVHSLVLAESKAQASRSLWLHTFIHYLTAEQQKSGIICLQKKVLISPIQIKVCTLLLIVFHLNPNPPLGVWVCVCLGISCYFVALA